MKKHTLPAVLLMAALATVSFGQQDNGGPGGGGGPGGFGGPGGGRPDPAQMRQQMEDRMKQQLGVTDDQWENLQPKIDKVQQLKRELRVGGGPGGPGGPGGRGPRGGQGGPGGGGQGADNQGGPGGGPGGRRGGGGFGGGPGGPPDPNSPVQLAVNDLRDAVQNNASEDTIKSKLATLRKAINDVKTQLAAAQKDLADATNLRQQAVLTTMNILD